MSSIPEPGSLFWSESKEAIPADELRKLEFWKLRQLLSYVTETSPFYRRMWDRSGFNPDQVRTIEDLARIPLITKNDLRKSQAEGGRLGGHCCAPLSDVVRVQGTSGTTGQLVYTGLTKRDAEVWAELFARHAWIGGLRPGDSIINPFNFALSVGGLSECISAEKMGLTVIPVPFSSVSIEKLIQIVKDLKPVVLCATPSLAIFLQEQIGAYLGVEPIELGFKKGFITGEVFSEQDRRKIENAWGIDARNYYGLTEVAPDLAAECHEKSGMHFVGQGYVLLELIDWETGSPKSLEDGVIGELVFTTLDRECCPVIRYRTGDVAQVWTSPCKCGRNTPRVKIIGRTDDVVKIGDIQVFPSAIQEIVASFGPETTGEMRIVLDKNPVHRNTSRTLKVKVEYGQGVSKNRLLALESEIREKVETALGLETSVFLVPPYSLPRSNFKGRYYE
ncbi:MAG: AMP-binding protein [Clostridia bacterium]|nr:AMP-binding protein [Clostridia bacterium]